MVLQARQFTPTEAAALVDLSEKQVRKELEYRVIDVGSPPRLSFSALVYLYLVRRSPLSFRVQERSAIYKRIAEKLAHDEVPEEIEVADPFYLRLGDRVVRLNDKVSQFMAWKERLVCDPDLMGGAETFPNSRLTVHRVGGMLEHGVPAEEILDDYPYLEPRDLENARMYVRAYPRVGRPGGGR